MGTGLEGHISVHAFQVIEFWPAQLWLELVSSKAILKGSHFKTLVSKLSCFATSHAGIMDVETRKFTLTK